MSSGSSSRSTSPSSSPSQSCEQKLMELTEKQLLVKLLLLQSEKAEKVKESKKRRKMLSEKQSNKKKLKTEPKELAEGMILSRENWQTAKKCLSGSAMTKFLVGKLFPLKELQESNYKGGGEANRKPLNEQKVTVIRDVVNNYFEISQQDFGKAVNEKCEQARRNKTRTKHMENVENIDNRETLEKAESGKNEESEVEVENKKKETTKQKKTKSAKKKQQTPSRRSNRQKSNR